MAYYEQQVEESEEREAAIPPETAPDSPTRQSARDSLDRYKRALRTAEVALEKRRASAESAGLIELSAQYSERDKREVTGTADELASYLEDKQFKSLEFSAPSGLLRGYRSRLLADRKTGVTLFVSASDSDWATSTFTQVSDEIGKNVPAWRWIRSPFFLVPFSYVIVFGTLALLFPPFASSGKVENSVVAWAVGVAAGLGLGVLVNVLAWLARRSIPAFELVRPGGRPRGWALVTFIGSGVFALVVGLVVNRSS